MAKDNKTSKTARVMNLLSKKPDPAAPQEEAAPLLPSGMAQALGSLYPGTELSVGYVDEGAGALKACWLAG